MAEPMSPERRAAIDAHARQPMYLNLAEEEPNSAVAHRLELLDEVERLTGQVAELQARLGQTRTVLPAEFFDALMADGDPQPVPELVALFQRHRAAPTGAVWRDIDGGEYDLEATWLDRTGDDWVWDRRYGNLGIPIMRRPGEVITLALDHLIRCWGPIEPAAEHKARAEAMQWRDADTLDAIDREAQ